MSPPTSLRDAALAYAARGFRVVPLHYPVKPTPDGIALCSCGDRACAAIGKHPLTPHGLHDATYLRAQVEWYWRRWPQANIGLLTGELVDVLDVDGSQGQAALSQWEAEHRLRLDTPMVRTGHGWHHYLQASGARNRIGLLDHVDWRGRGGYVVAPPSRHASGHRYRWVRPLGSQLPPLPAELELLVLPPQPERPQHHQFQNEPAGHPYGRKVLERELASVAAAPRGIRNHALYQAGIRLYSLVAGGVLDGAEVEAGLRNAAEASRLLEEEPAQTRRTLASAERTGLAHPRGIPLRAVTDGPGSPDQHAPRGRTERERDA
jgi:Bifunctional DNA primase/polymerase, N-terminal